MLALCIGDKCTSKVNLILALLVAIFLICHKQSKKNNLFDWDRVRYLKTELSIDN
jgi:hypothetical protein